MAVAATENFRWAFLYITKAALQASSTYNIENFAIPADVTAPGYGWAEPQRDGTLRPTYGRFAVNSVLGVRPDGFWEFTWSIKRMSPLMFKYINTNQFSSATLWSAPATVQTWDDNVMDYSVFQCTAWRPKPNRDYKIIDQQYIDVLYRFNMGVLL